MHGRAALIVVVSAIAHALGRADATTPPPKPPRGWKEECSERLRRFAEEPVIKNAGFGPFEIREEAGHKRVLGIHGRRVGGGGLAAWAYAKPDTDLFLEWEKHVRSDGIHFHNRNGLGVLKGLREDSATDKEVIAAIERAFDDCAAQ
jgi:hypothetical protein